MHGPHSRRGRRSRYIAAGLALSLGASQLIGGLLGSIPAAAEDLANPAAAEATTPSLPPSPEDVAAMVAAAAEHGIDEDALHAELAEAGLTADDLAGQIAEAGLEPAAVFARVQEAAVPLSEVLALQIDSTLPLADFFALMDDFIEQSDLGADAFVAQMAAALDEVEASAEVEGQRSEEEAVEGGTGTDVVADDEGAEPIDADVDGGGGAPREGIKAGTDPPALEDDPAPPDPATTETAVARETDAPVPSPLPWYDPRSQFNLSPFGTSLFSPLGATLGVNPFAATGLGSPNCNRELGGSFEQDPLPVVLGGFELDGNYCQNGDGDLDWGSPEIVVTDLHDGYGGDGTGPGASTPPKIDTTQLSSNMKEDDGAWTNYSNSNITGKPDIGRIMSYVPEDGDIRLIMGFERNTGQGEMTIFVELNQLPNRIGSQGEPTPNPNRRDGDLRMTFYQSGNAVPTLAAVHLWEKGRWADHTVVSAAAGVIDGRSNAGSAVAVIQGEVGISMANNTFFEMAINFTAMMDNTGDCLPSFSNINIRTTTSNGKNLQDWIGPGEADIPSTCSARLIVNKEIQDYDAEGDPISPRSPGAEWVFEVVALDDRVHIEGERRQSTDAQGKVIFPMVVDGGGAQTGALSITEPAVAGWGIRPDEQTGQNAVCWADNRSGGSDRYLPVINGPTSPLNGVGFETGWAPQSQQVGGAGSLVINAPHRWYMTGGTFTRMEDTADKANHILKMNGGALYSAPGLFEPGDTAWVAMRARIPAGSPAATVGFTVAGSGSTTGVGRQSLSPGDDWVWLYGSAFFGFGAELSRVETYTSTPTIVEIDDVFVLRSLDPSVMGANASVSTYDGDLTGQFVFGNGPQATADSATGTMRLPVVADSSNPANNVLQVQVGADWHGVQGVPAMFEPGLMYEVTAKVRPAQGVTSPMDAQFATFDFDAGGSFSETQTPLDDTKQALTAGVWTQVSTTFVAKSTTGLRLTLGAGQRGTFEVDDLSVKRIGAPGDARMSPGMTVLGIRSLDEVTCKVVNHLTGNLGVTNGWVFHDYDWWINKTATPATQHAAAGVGAEFDYRVTVGATADTPLVGATALIRNMLADPGPAAPVACPGNDRWKDLAPDEQAARQEELDTDPQAAAACGYLNLQGLKVFVWPGNGAPTYPEGTDWAGDPIVWEDLNADATGEAAAKADAALAELQRLASEGTITAVDVLTQPYGVPGVTEAAGALVPQPLIAPGARGRWEVVFPMADPDTMPFGGECSEGTCFTLLAYREPLFPGERPPFIPHLVPATVLDNDFLAGVTDDKVPEFGESITKDQCLGTWNERGEWSYDTPTNPQDPAHKDECTFDYSATLGTELGEATKGTYENTAKVDPLDWDQPWESSDRACVTDPETLLGADGDPCWDEDFWWGPQTPDNAEDGNVWDDPSIGPRAQDDGKLKSTAKVTVTTGASLTVEKTAQVYLSRNLNWEITKEADPTSAVADPAEYPFQATASYTITATPTAPTDVLRYVEGVITVANPNTHARNDDGVPTEGTGVPIQVRELPDFGADDPMVCTVWSPVAPDGWVDPEGWSPKPPPHAPGEFEHDDYVYPVTLEDRVTVPAAMDGTSGTLDLWYHCDFTEMAVEVTPDDPWWTDGSNTVEISWDKQVAYSGLGLGEGDPLTIPPMSILDAKRFTQEPYGLGVAKPTTAGQGLCPFVADALAWLVNDGVWAPTINTGTPWVQGTGCYTDAAQWNAGEPDPTSPPQNVNPADLLLDDDGRVRVGITFDQPGIGYVNPRHVVPGETLDEDVYCHTGPTGKVCYDGIAVDQDGKPLSQPTGFDVEVAKAVVARVFGDVEIVWVQARADERQHVLGACAPGEAACTPGDWPQVVDMVAATYTMNAARLGSVDFAGPYFQAGQGLLIRTADAGKFTVDPATKAWQPEDELVCSVAGSTSLALLEDMGVTVAAMDTLSQCVQALIRGDVDAVSTDDIILLAQAAQTTRVCPLDDTVAAEGENPAAAPIAGKVEDCYPQAEWDLLPDRAVAALIFDDEGDYDKFTKDDVRGEFVDVWDTFESPEAGAPKFLGMADWYEGLAARGGVEPGSSTRFGPFEVDLTGPFYGDDSITYVNRAEAFDRHDAECAVPGEPGESDPCTDPAGDPLAEDDAEVTITAPDSPVLSAHDAEATFGSVYTWTISKAVDGDADFYAAPGESTTVTYRLTATVTEERSDVTVSGSFTLIPPRLASPRTWSLEGLAVTVTDADGHEYPTTLKACTSSLDDVCSGVVPATLSSVAPGGNAPLTVRYATGSTLPPGSGPWTARITLGADDKDTEQDERFLLPTVGFVVTNPREVAKATRLTAVNQTATVEDIEFAEAFLASWDPPNPAVLGVDSADDGKVVLDAAAAIDGTPNGPLEHEWVLEYNATLTAPPHDGGTRTSVNTAVITPDSCAPGATDCPAQDKDTETVTVRTGHPLGVRAVVEGVFSAEFDWSIDKRIVDLVGQNPKIENDGSLGTAKGGSNGKATVTYQIEVTPEGFENPKPTLSGTLEVTNPNPWPVTATSFDLKFHLESSGTDPITCTAQPGVKVAASAGAVDASGAQVSPPQTVPFTCDIPPKLQEHGLPLGWLEASVSWDVKETHTGSGTSSNQRTQHESNFELTMLDAERFTTEPYGVGVAKDSPLCVPLAGAMATIIGDGGIGSAWSTMLTDNTGTGEHTYPFANPTGCYTSPESWKDDAPKNGGSGEYEPVGGDLVSGNAGVVRVGIKFDQPGLGYANPADIVDAAESGVCHDGAKSDFCYQTLKPGAEPRGLDVDIARALVADVFGDDTKIVWVHTPSATRQHALGACDLGEAGCDETTWSQVVDMIAATYTMNASRLGSVDFAGPYYQAGQGLLARTDDLNDDAFEVTDGGAWVPTGERVCSATGSTPLAYLKGLAADGADLQVVERTTYSACIRALWAGQVDAVSTDDVILLGYAKEEHAHDCANVIDDPDSPVVAECVGTTGARPAMWETVGDLNTIPETKVLGVNTVTQEPYGVGTAPGSPLCPAIAAALTGEAVGVGMTGDGVWAKQLDSLGLDPAQFTQFMARTGCWTDASAWPSETPNPGPGTGPLSLVGGDGKVRVGIKFDQPGLGYANPADIVDAGVCHEGAKSGTCYQTLTAGKEPYGFEVELAKAIVTEVFPEDTEIVWVHTPSATRQHALGACDPGEENCGGDTWSQVVDFVIGTYTMNASRLGSVDFAGPYFQAGQGLLVLDDEAARFTITQGEYTLKPGETAPTGLWSPNGGDVAGEGKWVPAGTWVPKGERVCSAYGSTPYQTLVKMRELGVNIEPVARTTYSACVRALWNGWVDAVSTDDIILAGFTEPSLVSAEGTPGYYMKVDDRIDGTPVSDKPYEATGAQQCTDVVAGEGGEPATCKDESSWKPIVPVGANPFDEFICPWGGPAGAEPRAGGIDPGPPCLFRYTTTYDSPWPDTGPDEWTNVARLFGNDPAVCTNLDGCKTAENAFTVDPDKDDDATVKITATPPTVTVDVSARTQRDYDWKITKTADRDSVRVGADGSIDVAYTLQIVATPDDSADVWVGGTVTLLNEEAFEVPRGELKVLVGDVPTTVEAGKSLPPAVGGIAGAVTVKFGTWLSPAEWAALAASADEDGDVPVVVRHGTHTLDSTTTLSINGLTPHETNDTAVLTDTFQDELKAAVEEAVEAGSRVATIDVDGNVVVGATECSPADGCALTYKVTFGPDNWDELFGPDGWDAPPVGGVVHNEATLAPAPPNIAEVCPTQVDDLGFCVDPEDSQTPGDLTDDEDVEAQFGQPLTVDLAVDAKVTRTYEWSIAKQVQCVPAEGCALREGFTDADWSVESEWWTDQPVNKKAGLDGTADYTFRVTVTAEDAAWSDWDLGGQATITNPNSWDIPITEATLDAAYDDVTCDWDPGLGADVSVPASGSLTLDYTCAPDEGTDLIADPEGFAGSITGTVTWDFDYTAGYTGNHTGSTTDTVNLYWADSGVTGEPGATEWQVTEIDRYRDVFDAMVDHQLTATLDWRTTTEPVTRVYTVTLRSDETTADTANLAWLADGPPPCEPGDPGCPAPCDPIDPGCVPPCDPEDGTGCDDPPPPPVCEKGDPDCTTIPVDVVDPDAVTHTVTGEAEYTIDYAWNVVKKAFHNGTELSEHSEPVQVLPGKTATIDYQIVATATRSTSRVTVTGQVCLAGDPDVDTWLPQTRVGDQWTPTISGWVLANTIQYDWFELKDFTFDDVPTMRAADANYTGNETDLGRYYLPKGETKCLGYESALDPLAAERNVTVNVRLGDPGTVASSETITPDETVNNESATLADSFDAFCASLPGEHGVKCVNGAVTLELERSDTWPNWPAGHEWTFDYEAELGHADGGSTLHRNVATLHPVDDEEKTDDAEVTIERTNSFELGVENAKIDASVKHTYSWSVVKETCETGTACDEKAAPGQGGWTTAKVTRKPGLDGTAEFQYRVIVTAGPDTWTDWHLSGEFTVTNPNEWEVPAAVSATYAGVPCQVADYPGGVTVPPATEDGPGELPFTFACELGGNPPLTPWTFEGDLVITVDPDGESVLGGVGDTTVKTFGQKDENGINEIWDVDEKGKFIDVYDHLIGTTKLNEAPLEWASVGAQKVFAYTKDVSVTDDGGAGNTAWLVPVDPPCKGEGCEEPPELPDPPVCEPDDEDCVPCEQDGTCASTVVEVPEPSVISTVAGEAKYTYGYDWNITKTASHGGEEIDDGGTVKILPVPPATAKITYQLEVTATRSLGTLAVDGLVCLWGDPEVDTWLPNLSGTVLAGTADPAQVTFAYDADGLADHGLGQRDGRYYLAAETEDLCIPYSWSAQETELGALEYESLSAGVTVGDKTVLLDPLEVKKSVTNAQATLTDDSFDDLLCTVSGDTDFPCMDAVLLPGDMGEATDGTVTKTFTYTADLGAGTYKNVAVLDPSDSDPVKDDHTVEISATQEQPLTVTHVPTATITRTHSWEIVKEVQDPSTGGWVTRDDLTFVTGLDGQAQVRYRVVVTRTAEAWADAKVTGTATVSNPNTWPVEAQVSVTMSEPGWACTIDKSASVEVAPAGEKPGTAEVGYTCLPTEPVTAKPGGAVTVSVTWESTDESSTSNPSDPVVGSEQQVSWTVNEVNGSVTVWDDGAGTLQSPRQIGVVGWEQTTIGVPRIAGDYTLTLTDPDVGGDPVAYTNVARLGTDPDNPDPCVDDPATEDADCVDDERKVEVTQPDPVDLVADGRVQVDYDWTITKDVDQPTVHLAPGETRDVTYTITLNSVANRGRVWVGGELTLGGPVDATDLAVTINDAPVMHEVLAAEPDGPVTLRYWTWFETAPVGPQRLEVYAGHGTPEPVLVLRGDVEVLVETTYTDERVTVSDELFPAGFDPGVRYAQDCLPGQWNAAKCQFTYTVTLGGAPGSQSTTTNVAVLHVQPPPEPFPNEPVIPTCEAAPDGEEVADPEEFCIEPHDDDTDEDDADVDVKVGYRPDLSITKAMDSEMTFQRLYTWQIEKVADGPDRKEMGDDATASFDYLVTLTPGAPVDSQWRLTGEITVTNPNPLPVDGARITEHPDAAGVTCALDPTRMPAGASAAAGFTIPAATVGADGELVPGQITVGVLCDAAGPVLATAANAATVTWDSQELGTANGSATVRVEFGELALRPTSFVDDAIQVFDQLYGGTTADPDARLGEPALLGTASRDADGELVCEPAPGVRLGTTDGACQFGYSSDELAGPAHAGTVTEYYNEAWIEQTGQKDGQVVTVTDTPVFDGALRTWTQSVYRQVDGTWTEVYQSHSAADDPGPADGVDDVNVTVGDVLVHAIRLFNQGTQVLRVDELVFTTPTGMVLAGKDITAAIGRDHNDGWVQLDDTLFGYHVAADSGREHMVLMPGEELEIHLTQVISPAAVADGEDSALLQGWAEISQIHGLICSEQPCQAPLPLDTPAGGPGRSAPLRLPTVAHFELWEAGGWAWGDVDDVDSTPDRLNEGLNAAGEVDHTRYWDNEINGTAEPYDPAIHSQGRNQNNDEDDHDGVQILVHRRQPAPTVPATPPAVLPRTGAAVASLLLLSILFIASGSALRRHGARHARTRTPGRSRQR